jgi:hypothetical protein
MPPGPPVTPPPFFTFDRTLQIIGVVLATVFSIVFIVIALRWKRRLPCYAVLSNTLLRDQTARLPALDVRFSGVAVQSLTIARVAIWNAGRETIRADDVATSAPLTLATPENARILEARVIQSTSPPSAMNLAVWDRNEVRMTFEFLDHRQGSVIEVLHTGTTTQDLTLKGTIRGGSAIRRMNVAAQAKGYIAAKRLKQGKSYRTFDFLGQFVLVPLWFGALAVTLWKQFNSKATDVELGWVLALSFIGGIGVVAVARLNAASRSLPPGFEKIAEGLFDE